MEQQSKTNSKGVTGQDILEIRERQSRTDREQVGVQGKTHKTH